MKTDPYYPDWLGPGLIDDAVADADAVETTLEAFLDAYTLHDSYWIALVTHPWAAHLAIRFDANWSDGRIPYPGSVVAEWPILIVTMRRLVSARIELQDAGIGEAISVPHDTAEGMATTLVGDHLGGSAELVHGSSIELRCFDRAGAAIPIPLD